MSALARAGEQVGFSFELEEVARVGERGGGREDEVEACARVKESWEDSEEEVDWRERRRRTRETRPVLLERRAGKSGERDNFQLTRRTETALYLLTRLLLPFIVDAQLVGVG